MAGEHRDTLTYAQIVDMTRVIDTLVPCSLVSTILREDDTDRLEDQIDHHDDVVFSDPYFEKVTDSIEILYNGCFV